MDLEDRLLWIVKAGIAVSGAALAAGLLLHSPLLLAIGLIVLMATPATRVVLATAERIRRRDWQFVAITLLVIVELSAVLWLATTRN